jgi:hypothetical protein
MVLKRIIVIVILISLTMILIPYGNIKADQINVQTLSSIDTIGTIKCSTDSKPVSVRLIAPLDGAYYTGLREHMLSWEVKQYPENLTRIIFILTDQNINKSSGGFVITGLEAFDSLCNKHIDLLRPPKITFHGICHDAPKIDLYDSAGMRGTFKSFKDCLVIHGPHA